MNTHDFKILLANSILSQNTFAQRVSEIEIRTRCPYCGDSRKNLHTGHLYIRINPNDNYPIVYNCFKCPAQGILKYEDLELLGIEGSDYKQSIVAMNKTSDKISNGNSTFDVPDRYFEYKLPEISYKCNKIKYIENRIGYDFQSNDMIDCKIITSLKDFLILNNIDYINCKPYIAKIIEDHYVGFLSNNGAYILFRDITDNENIRWYKYPISKESQGQQLFYSMSSEIDLYTDEPITINLSEGVLDCLSVAYNLDNTSNNTLNIAVGGKFYNKIIKRLITTGFIGSNITINIYADRDYTYDTGIEFYKKTLSRYKYFVKEINILYNLLYKDCGVPADKIKIEKHKI